MSKPIHFLEAVAESDTHLPAELAKKMGHSEWRSLGTHFGLQQFAVNVETLHPGARSSLRHWHSRTDEFVFVLEGELVLVTDEGETVLGSGMCAGFAAGVENAHHLLNRSDQSASFLVAGSRVAGDKVHYPDDDMQWLPDSEGKPRAARKDGSFY